MFKILKFKVAYKWGNGIHISDVAELKFNDLVPSHAVVNTKEMVDGQEVTDTMTLPIDLQSVFLMECTTKYDKKGYLIYTGMVAEKEDKTRYVISFFDAGYYAFNPDNENDYILLSEGVASQLTIIGNIYQNPELGEKKIDFNKEVENAEKNPDSQVQ